MMKQLTIAAAMLSLGMWAQGQQAWAPAGQKIKTEWAAQVDPASPLPEYPRPQMVRKNWTSLNGLWQYAILPRGQQNIPAGFAGQILVPFAVESALSGVGIKKRRAAAS
jgi:hypothetical protein